MRKRLLYGLAIISLAISLVLVVWQGSFNIGNPADPSQTIVFWALTIINFILMVTLSFMLGRMALKLYFERRGGREGSRIKTKLVLGAMGLILLPVFFMVFFSVNVLSYNMARWFTGPAQGIENNLNQIDAALHSAWVDRASAQAELLATMPDAIRWITGDQTNADFMHRFCGEQHITGAAITIRGEHVPALTCGQFPVRDARPNEVTTVGRDIYYSGHPIGIAFVASRIPLNIVQKQREIAQSRADLDRTWAERKSVRQNMLQFLSLITLFILFAGSWLANFLARQISGPIAALVKGAEEVSKGNLQYRINSRGIDELAGLIKSFNQMTQDLEANSRELEARRRFTEAILESIPTGVISVNSAGVVQRVNRALQNILPLPWAGAAHDRAGLDRAIRLEDLFSRDDAAEIRYLMNRARRTGIAAQQFEIQNPGRILHLAITVSALEDRSNSGFVIVLEDTSDLLRAQKAAAWREVARRIAHEIKNPLTPITLSAERILRQLGRGQASPSLHEGAQNPERAQEVIRECAETIVQEAQTVKNLVDEFSQFSRFPAAQPAPCDLNEVVESGLSVFAGRLEDIEIHKKLAPGLPQVNIDREQFKRVVVNLVDNAAEAMTESLIRHIYIETKPGLPDTVELIVADTGCGVTAEDKEKLFLPYFSTKGRGTGLGLAIVNHVISDHSAHIRVEDNSPVGARFTIEIPAIVEVSEPVSV